MEKPKIGFVCRFDTCIELASPTGAWNHLTFRLEARSSNKCLSAFEGSSEIQIKSQTQWQSFEIGH